MLQLLYNILKNLRIIELHDVSTYEISDFKLNLRVVTYIVSYLTIFIIIKSHNILNYVKSDF